MPNTTTTPASVAAWLKDEEILKLAEQYELTAPQTVANDSIRKHYTNSAAVLRDYVRLRKLANAVKAKVDAVNAMPSAPLSGGMEDQKINGEKLCAKITAFAEITCILAGERRA